MSSNEILRAYCELDNTRSNAIANQTKSQKIKTISYMLHESHYHNRQYIQDVLTQGGCGNSTISQVLSNEASSKYTKLNIDSIPIPTIEEMQDKTDFSKDISDTLIKCCGFKMHYTQ